MATETVRVKSETYAKLKVIARESGHSMPEVLEAAIEALRRNRLLNDTNRGYAALRDDPRAWKSEQTERARWEATLDDAVEDDA